MKKIICFVLSVLFALAISLTGCKKNDSSSIDNPPEESKPMLLFQVDEGHHDYEMMGAFRNDFQKLRNALDYVFDSTEPLTEKYDVSFAFHCQFQYKESGYGGDPSDPANRIAPELKEVLSYAQTKGQTIILEQISSDIRTYQFALTGETVENPQIPAVPVNYGGSEYAYGTSMDMQALEWLMQTYPSVGGVRFHEMIGSQKKFGATVAKVSLSTARATIELCEKYDKLLVWGDQYWDNLYDSSKFPADWASEWKEIVLDACERLGENLVINGSNNSWDIVKSLSLDAESFLKKTDRPGASIGFSVQSWFWQESSVCMTQWSEGTKWYTAAYQDMPVELMAAFTFGSFENGAKLVQFEPTTYFYNWHMAGNDIIDYDGFYESAPDYSPRITMKRFVELLLADKKDLPVMMPSSYYSKSESLLRANDEANPPKKYNQSSLYAIGNNNSKTFDVFNVDPSKLYEFNDYRLTDSVKSGDILAIERIALTYGCRDEFFVLKQTENGIIGQFYYYNSSCLYTERNAFADNENGKILSAVAVNLKRNYSKNLGGDPDEIVVARKKNGTVTFEVLCERDTSVSSIWSFEYVKDTDSEELLKEYIGCVSMPADRFGKLLAYRTRNAVYRNDQTRVTEYLGYCSYGDDSIHLNLSLIPGVPGAKKINISQDIPVGGSVIDVTVVDINLDVEDDIAVMYRDADGNCRMDFYMRDGLNFIPLSLMSQSLGKGDFSRIFSMRTTTYYNKALGY